MVCIDAPNDDIWLFLTGHNGRINCMSRYYFMLTRSARRGTWFYCQKLRVTVKMLVMMDSWTTTSLSLVCVLEKKTSLLHPWCFPCLSNGYSNESTWEYIWSRICRHRITMFIFTFSIGNDGQMRGFREFNSNKKYVYTEYR